MNGVVMAILFGRVKKTDYEYTALFANIVPVYVRDLNNYHQGPVVAAANGCPEFVFTLVSWIVCNLPMPYDGFMFTKLKKIKE